MKLRRPGLRRICWFCSRFLLILGEDTDRWITLPVVGEEPICIDTYLSIWLSRVEDDIRPPEEN